MGNCVGKTTTTLEHSSCNEPSILRFEKDFGKGECIGQGSFGKVYRCKSRIDEHDYAIKEIPFKKEDTKELRKQLRECRSHAKLLHPNIVRYYDDWIEDASLTVPSYILYVKMELYNCTLESYLDQRMSSADDISSYNFQFETMVMNSLFAAVAFLHLKDIVHCDINPSNVFIKVTKDNGRVLLGNFSFARQIPLYASSKQNTSNETDFPERSKWSVENETLFSAPEQSSYNHRKPVDVYSTGVVVYDLFNYVKTKNERYVMLNEFRNSQVVSENICLKFEALATLISMMCDKKAKQRPTINEVLAYIFKNKINNDPVNPWVVKFPQNSYGEQKTITHSVSGDNEDLDQFRATSSTNIIQYVLCSDLSCTRCDGLCGYYYNSRKHNSHSS
uniref:non-specific serine/threonine protein kinase n=1 Tax=Panagrellus redivivus TaxID=6233 RepID=A0A7E4W8Z1_PANRE